MAPSPRITSSLTNGTVHHILASIFSLRWVYLPIIGCSAFQHQQQPIILSASSYSRSRPFLKREPSFRYDTASGIADQSIDDINVSEKNDQLFQGETNTSNLGCFELWLDLRGTSLTPKAAAELWDLEERQSNSMQQQPLERNSNDRELTMARAPYVKCLVSSTEKSQVGYTPQNDDELYPNSNVLLIAEFDDGGDMKSISQMTSETTSKSIGRIQSLQASSSMPILPDPLPAIDVASKGQWVILDTDGWKKFDEEERSSMALPLMGLIHSGSLGSSTSGGGVGLTCYTPSEVVKTAMFIESIANGGGGGSAGQTKTMESGIVIPDSDAVKSPVLCNAKFAIIVPFDIGLLRTAKLLVSDL